MQIIYNLHICRCRWFMILHDSTYFSTISYFFFLFHYNDDLSLICHQYPNQMCVVTKWFCKKLQFRHGPSFTRSVSIIPLSSVMTRSRHEFAKIRFLKECSESDKYTVLCPTRIYFVCLLVLTFLMWCKLSVSKSGVGFKEFAWVYEVRKAKLKLSVCQSQARFCNLFVLQFSSPSGYIL